MSDPIAVIAGARSIAVVGASARPGALGRLPLDYLARHRFSGRIVPITPFAAEVLGHAAYPSLREAPKPIDLALVLVAAERVPEVIDDCAAAGVPLAIVGASGFSESDTAGKALEADLVARARRGGVRLMGPNCIGAVAFHHALYATFSPLFQADLQPVPGGIGLVSQSGAVGYGIVSLALDRGLSLGWAITTGNEADLTAAAAMAELATLPACQVVLGYVEGLADPVALRALAACETPAALLVGGTSKAGATAAASHTGALATGERLVEAALAQLGIAHARDIDELLDIGAALASPRRAVGHRIAVVSTSGGAGILGVDEVERAGLELAELGPDTVACLEKVIPPFGSSVNPVDVTAVVMRDPAVFAGALDAVATDPGVDLMVACFCVLTGAEAEAVSSAVIEATRHGKPIFVSRTGSPTLSPAADTALRAAGVPCYPSPSRAVRAAAALLRTATARWAPIVREPEGRTAPPLEATEPELKALLADAGVRVPRGRVVASPLDARSAVRDLGGEAVLKAVVRGLFHKTEAGGVLVGISEDETGGAYARLSALGGVVLVEEYVSPSAEVLVGVASRPLGLILTVGAGGLLAEIIADVAFRLLPVGRSEIEAMLDETALGTVLAGHRGRPPLARAALVEVIERLAALVTTWEAPFELDLNPVAVTVDRAVVLDAAITTPEPQG